MLTKLFFDTEAAGAELDQSPIAIQRLIARRKIPATRMGADGAWRITQANLETYLDKGAPDLTPPALTGEPAPWFAPAYTRLAGQFESALVAAAQEQVPSDADVLAALRSAPKGVDSVDFVIKSTGAVAKLLQAAPPDKLAYNAPDLDGYVTSTVQTPFARWSSLYAAQQLRDMARRVISRTNPAARALEVLYDSPESYADITNEAYQEAAKRRIVFSKAFRLPTGKPGGELATAGAYFLFPISEIMTPATSAKLIDLAF